ncbi:AAEL005867-PA, partial [Aedes aegypti]
MPPFMYRGNGGGGGNSVTPPPSSNEDINRGNTGGGNGGSSGGGMRSNNSNMGYNSMLPSFVAPPTNHHQSHGSNYSPTQSGGRYRDSYSGGRRGQMQPPRLANRQQQHQNDDHRSQTAAPAYVEPDILVQRPIIRDEELQRIEAIAKDEGWAKDDEIDYNQKLQFSDDELEPSPPKEIPMSVVKQEKSPSQIQQQQQQMQQQQLQQQQSQQEDDKRMAWSREVEREQERLEQEQIERLDRERQEKEREQTNMRPVQQNGHIGGRGLDAEAKERLKQRREEDQKREMERKQAAARKLQELEQKLSQKKNEDNVVGSVTSPATTKDGEDRDLVVAGFNESGESKERSSSSVRGGDRERLDSKEYRDRDRDRFEYGRYDRDYRDRDRGERDRTERDRTERARGEQDRERDAWGEVPPYSKNFQSNLPPRFQKRKLERNPSGNSLQGSGSYITRDQNITRNSSTANQGSMMSQSQPQTENKSVPFAQQYDPRFIHSQQNFGKSQS